MFVIIGALVVLGAILDGNQFDTFYHEHPRTYSYSSFARIAATQPFEHHMCISSRVFGVSKRAEATGPPHSPLT